MLTQKISRREFLWRSVLLGAGATFPSVAQKAWGGSRILGANDRLRIAVVGLGKKGIRHLSEYLKLPKVEIAAICDLDEEVLEIISGYLERNGFQRPARFKDYRRLLDAPDINVLSVATPKNLRSRIGIDACQAGKDIFFEKPFASSLPEGELLIEAVRKTNRIAQQRDTSVFSVSDINSLMPLVNLNEIKAVRGWKTVETNNSVKEKQDTEWQLDSVLDEIDLARCLMGVEFPDTVSTVRFNKETRSTPTTLALQFGFNNNNKSQKRSINFELKTQPRRSKNIESREKNFLFLERDDDETTNSSVVFSTDGGEFTVAVNSKFDKSETANSSWENFVSGVRAKDSSQLRNTLSEAHKSNTLVHLAEKSLLEQKWNE